MCEGGQCGGRMNIGFSPPGHSLTLYVPRGEVVKWEFVFLESILAVG
jgi:hypothetical protein